MSVLRKIGESYNDAVSSISQAVATSISRKRQDGIEQFDFLIVFGKQVKKLEENPIANQLISRLKMSGMIVEEVNSSKVGQISIAIAGTQDVLFMLAEKQKLRLELKKPSLGRTSAIFRRSRIFEFKGSSHDEKIFFCSGDRITLLSPLITECEEMKLAQGLTSTQIDAKGERINPNNQERASIIDIFIPLHDEAEVKRLSNQLVNGVNNVPMKEIRQYLGSECAFYFSFIMAYSYWLLPAAVVGGIVFYFQMKHGYDGALAQFYSLFMSVWVTAFLEYWKRREARLRFEWNLEETTLAHEDIREAYKLRSTMHVDPTSKVIYWMYPTYLKILYVTISLAGCALLVVCAGTAIAYFLYLDRYAKAFWVGESWSGVWSMLKHLPVLGYFASIAFFTNLNRVVAQKMTELENPSTKQDYDNSLMFKLLVLQFLTNNGLLFYTAFVDRNIPELHARVYSLLGLYQLIGQVVEVGIPVAKSVFNIASSIHSTKTAPPTENNKKGLPLVGQKDISLVESEGLFPEFVEMWTQFGQVVLFSVVFPLAPLLAYINNVIEIRTDAFKMLKLTRRGIPRPSSGIGIWLQAFELLGYVAVTTNVGLVGVMYFRDESETQFLAGWSVSEKLLLFGFIEHVIICVKLLVSAVIPDVPSDISFETMARDQIAQREQELEFEVRNKIHELVTNNHSGRLLLATTDDTVAKLIHGVTAPATQEEGKTAEAMLTEWVNEQVIQRRHAQQQVSSLEQQLNGSNQEKETPIPKFNNTIAILNVAVGLVSLIAILTSEARKAEYVN